MVDITLAECEGQVWLVTGEDMIDDLLLGSLPPDTGITFVQCATRAEVWAMWAVGSLEPTEGVDPWIIHPNIVRRIKGTMLDPAVLFTAWSAQIGPEGEEAITRAARQLADAPSSRVTLRQFTADPMPPGQADLQRLRAMLVRSALQSAGAPAAQLHEESVPSAAPGAADRMELLVTT